MNVEGFRIEVSELDGYRFIESIFPPEIDSAKLMAVVTDYYALWDEERPTVTLGDVSGVTSFDRQASEVLMWVIQRSRLRPELLASAWVTGGNAPLEAVLRKIFDAAGRLEDVFEDREQALAFLRARIGERGARTE